ncbi:MAG: Stp1/IreP family PP2C-type Ser/Thr phosphatase [Burkholderiales bacterium]|nr:Stp1/IreP family PP2C-type Ser/Thr phosphatase [Burkholderiales bacterium]
MAYHVVLELAAKTDTGQVRSHNEDFIAINSELGFVILADGMGGYSAGEVASSIATTVVQETLEEQLPLHFKEKMSNRSKQLQQLVLEAVDRANGSIMEAARNEPQFSGMGTTVVVGLFHHDTVTFAHVGDSRAYRFRQGALEQITRDHSLLQEQIDAGLITPEAAQNSPNKNLITRAVGVDYEIEIEIHDHAVKPGDIYLLCSDGLSDMLTDPEIAAILGNPKMNLDAACAALIEGANKHGGKDNISAILAKVVAIDTKAEKFFGRVLKRLGIA